MGPPMRHRRAARSPLRPGQGPFHLQRPAPRGRFPFWTVSIRMSRLSAVLAHTCSRPTLDLDAFLLTPRRLAPP
eukprot:748571-Heterocapsa_arctica.AAC.1